MKRSILESLREFAKTNRIVIGEAGSQRVFMPLNSIGEKCPNGTILYFSRSKRKWMKYKKSNRRRDLTLGIKSAIGVQLTGVAEILVRSK